MFDFKGESSGRRHERQTARRLDNIWHVAQQGERDARVYVLSLAVRDISKKSRKMQTRSNFKVTRPSFFSPLFDVISVANIIYAVI